MPNPYTYFRRDRKSDSTFIVGPREREVILEFARLVNSTHQAAELFGRSKQTINTIQRRAGLPVRRRGNYTTAELMAQPAYEADRWRSKHAAARAQDFEELRARMEARRRHHNRRKQACIAARAA